MNSTIKFAQINKGVSDLSSRVEHIKQVLQQHKPHVLIINELNLSDKDIVSSRQFEDYNMEVDNLGIVDGNARTGVLIYKDLHYKRRRDLETIGTSTVWLQFSYPGRKSLLLQAIYRQFQRMGKHNTATPAAQKHRWTQIISKVGTCNDRRKGNNFDGRHESQLFEMGHTNP